MGSIPRHGGRTLHSQLSSSLKQRRSGYEPSDTETEWQDSPWRELDQKTEDLDHQVRNKSPVKLSRRTTGNLENGEYTSPAKPVMLSPTKRRHSRSPFAPRRDDIRNVSPFSRSELGRVNEINPDSDNLRTVSPFSRSGRPRYRKDDVKHEPEIRRNVSQLVSPYKGRKDDHWLDDDEGIMNTNRKQKQANNYSRRTVSAPRARLKEYESFKHEEQKRTDKKNLSPLPRNTSRKEKDGHYKHKSSSGEINEMLANAKISKTPPGFDPTFESTESIAPGDIFFSKDYAAFTVQDSIFSRNGSQKTEGYPERNPDTHQRTADDHLFNQHTRMTSASTVSHSIQSNMNTSSVASRQTSNLSDYSGRTNGSVQKFVSNRQKNQSEAWFSCINIGSCRRSKKSPEKERTIYEASVIEKAYVIENLREFWADKHRPNSLTGFICHKQEALLLKQLISSKMFPPILLKGPPGSGKKALTMALLHEIYGPPAWNVSHGLRYFHVQVTKAMEVTTPISSSPHHVELDVNSEPNAIHALIALVKQIRAELAVVPEISHINMKADYKVIVLYGVDKAADNIQHLIKWIMDGYSDACKLILCCEDDSRILEHVKSKCKVFKIEPPVTHEIMEVLIQISRKEDFELPMSFAAKVANKSKQNLRRAIMALEACKSHNYPFVEDQPIPIGWEEAVAELASDILSDSSSSNNKLFLIRGKFQKLLLDFVHPKLILLKLVEQLLKRVEPNSRRELYYWHAYYDKRLPAGTSALLKLEEFSAKIMSICKRNYNQYN